MKQTIVQSIQSLADSQQANVLFACESGSRAWGFPSPDSDYDARFIYLLPRKAYLSLHSASEHLSMPVTEELDVCGWDLRKMLKLMVKSNCTPFEWLQSPIVYAEKEGFRDSILEMLPLYFNAGRQTKHYLGMAHSALSTMEGNRIGIKKLFYVLRPLLSAKWIVTTDEYPPMTIQPLLTLAPAGIQHLVQELIQLKAETMESAPIEVPPVLLNFIHEQMQTLADMVPPENRMPVSTAGPDAYFQELLS